MNLKRLEIAGFKSFAKKSALEFKTPITSIVGPNGSGKSNVAESFRFVLGEQSMKSMRGKKVEDLIFNGSAKTPRQSRASVKLTFDNTRKLFDVDFDEVFVERVIHRDASSEYKINGSPVRLKDIQELLAGAHIGASGHHIISQGETDRILNVNPKERKAMIEDALGLKVYQYKKTESERKLEKTEANKKEVDLLRREIKPHLKFLERQVQKIEKAREMREELVALYREYFKRESLYIEHTKSRLGAERHPLEQEIARIKGEREQAQATLTRLEEARGVSEEEKQAEGELRSIQDEKNEVVRDLGRLEGRVGAAEMLLKREKRENQRQAKAWVALKDIEGFVAELDHGLASAETSNDVMSVRGMIARLRATVRDFLQKHAVSSEQKDEEQDKKVDTEEELVRLKQEQQELASRLHTIESREQAAQQKVQELKARIEEDTKAEREAQASIFALANKENELTIKLNQVISAQERLRLEEEEYKRELGEAGVLAGKEAVDFQNEQLTSDPVEEPRKIQEERKKRVEKLKIRLEDAGVASHDDILREYNEVKERDAFLARELEDLDKSADSLRELIKDLEEQLAQAFKEGVTKINKEFQELFAIMFGGGNASLKVVQERKGSVMRDEEGNEIPQNDEDVQMEEGVELDVKLPRKKIRGLQMLSGGERALTSIALLFAMSQVNPPPFLVLDETDAALDEANSRRYGDMIERLATHSQLIVISHNRETMSRAGVLYGVTMGGDGVSQLLSVDFEEAVKVAK